MKYADILLCISILIGVSIAGCLGEDDDSDSDDSAETEEIQDAGAVDDDEVEDDVDEEPNHEADEDVEDNADDEDDDVTSEDDVTDESDDVTSEDDEDDEDVIDNDDEVINEKPIPVLNITGSYMDNNANYVFDISEPIFIYTSNSTDSDGLIIKYTLHIGVGDLISSNVGIETSHIYEYPGKYNITLTVMDDDSEENSTYFEILVVEEWGYWAEKIITDNEYTDISIEIDLIGQVETTESSINLFRERINQYCIKPHGITISETTESNDEEVIETTGDLWRIMMKYRDSYTDQDTLRIYIMYFGQDYPLGNALGLTFESTSFAVFKGPAYDSLINEKFSEEEIDQAVIIHEFFHLTGLVNRDYESDYPHEAKRVLHRGHCVDDECIMYYAIDTYDVKKYYEGKLPNDLCYYCQEDMKRYD